MKKIKILNLYAGIGGNRRLWDEVAKEAGIEIEVTAIELDENVAAVYKDLFPNDIVIVVDAHQYLLDNYEYFDIVWGSPPCPSHSRINYSMVRKLDYPDMKLYQEIIFLKQWFKGKFIIENVIPYYTPLIPAKEIDRHLFWTNFNLGNFTPTEKAQIRMQGERLCIDRFQDIFGFYLSKYKLKHKRKALRNCVHPETGKYILECALGVISKQNTTQISMFQ